MGVKGNDLGNAKFLEKLWLKFFGFYSIIEKSAVRM
jgi:hypothetical protein